MTAGKWFVTDAADVGARTLKEGAGEWKGKLEEVPGAVRLAAARQERCDRTGRARRMIEQDVSSNSVALICC